MRTKKSVKHMIVGAILEVLSGKTTSRGDNYYNNGDLANEMADSIMESLAAEGNLVIGDQVPAKVLNEEQWEHLQKAFKSACNLSFASTKDNYAPCTSFHKKPFHSHWDNKTLKEVQQHVRIYNNTWVIYPMEQALGLNRNEVRKEGMNSRKRELKYKRNKK